ncbi:MAG: hypothetical protein HY738_00520 [Bacteroidia bacterium]|nr:hypothetical protein [Bacteroidia bacterium]
MIDFITFKDNFKQQAIFTRNDILVRYGNFYMKNLYYWQKKGLVIKLRNECYCFSEFIKLPRAKIYVCYELYKPCYISMQTALSYYKIIPDAVVTSIGITTNKTKYFSNFFGGFYYYNIKKELFFGYILTEINPDMFVYIAEKEKSILDYLYLGTWISATKKGIYSERFDENEIMTLNWDKLYEYLERFNSVRLVKKVNILRKINDKY